jgi:hypothetical protein
VRRWRAIAALSLAAVAVCSPALDRGLVSAWAFAQQAAWFRHDMFEPLVAVGSFFVWIHVWFAVDRLASSGRAPGLRKYQLVPKPLLASGDASAGASAGDASAGASAGSGAVSGAAAATVAARSSPRQVLSQWYAGWPWEMAVYLVPLWILATQTNAFAARRVALDLAAPTIGRMAGEIVGGA